MVTQQQQHVGRHIDAFDWVHGGYGVGQKNLQGKMLVEFCLDSMTHVSTTWLKRGR